MNRYRTIDRKALSLFEQEDWYDYVYFSNLHLNMPSLDKVHSVKMGITEASLLEDLSKHKRPDYHSGSCNYTDSISLTSVVSSFKIGLENFCGEGNVSDIALKHSLFSAIAWWNMRFYGRYHQGVTQSANAAYVEEYGALDFLKNYYFLIVRAFKNNPNESVVDTSIDEILGITIEQVEPRTPLEVPDQTVIEKFDEIMSYTYMQGDLDGSEIDDKEHFKNERDNLRQLLQKNKEW